MSILRRSQARRIAVRSEAADPHIDSFGAWVSFLVVFASVMAVIVVWQNFNDHAYSLASGTTPHALTTAIAER
jgi:hypothetical protein